MTELGPETMHLVGTVRLEPTFRLPADYRFSSGLQRRSWLLIYNRASSLHGRLGKQERAAVTSQLGNRCADDPILLVATASFVGEGFDCPPLDTVFLAFPLAWKGSVVQYVGRVMRAFEGKQHVEVHDYVDARIPVIRRMHDKRLVGYNLLGFDVPRSRWKR